MFVKDAKLHYLGLKISLIQDADGQASMMKYLVLLKKFLILMV
jgi:hypothetical protein